MTEAMSTKASVFMPVYNAGEYLKVAIESILNQDFKDFEFVIVNDGSTDGSLDIIKSYSDTRIRLIDNPKNLGLIGSLNIGMEQCKGEYIVRMDQDDISLPQRLSKQISFMDENPEYGLIGSWFEDFGENIESRFVKYSSDDAHIRLRHLYQTHISHPTAVMRTAVIRQHNIRFDPEFVHGEDYNCWVTFSEYCKLSNFPEVLVKKRDHPSNITNKYASVMHATCTKVKQRQFDKMGTPISNQDADLYSRFANPEWNFSLEEMQQLNSLLNKLLKAHSAAIAIPELTFKKYLAEKWFHLCYQNKNLQSSGITWWMKNDLYQYYQPTWLQNQRLALRKIGLPV
jgi:glycosyltransferase involved in cell wall biosynthesis